jgi:peptidyl-prolyl cis-trans isomerase D
MPSNKITDITTASKNSANSTKQNPKPSRPQFKLSWILSLILLILIVIAFGLSPLAGAFGGGGNELVFGYFDGEPIAYTYNSFFYNQREIIAQNWDTDTTEENYEYQIYQIWKQAYDNTVIHTALTSEAQKSGMIVTDEAVDRYLLTTGPYISNGKFDRELYNSVSTETRKQIRQDVSDSLLKQQLSDDLFGAFIVPDEISFIAEMGRTEKAFDYVIFPLSAYPDDEAAAYGEANSSEFRSADVSIITFSSENRQEAEAVYNRIADGSLLFEDAARTYSIDTFSDNGGEAGTVYYHEMKEGFNNEDDLSKVFSLNAGEISTLLETPYGYNIYQLNSAVRQPDFADEKVLSKIKNYLISRERGLVEDYITGEALAFSSAAEENFSIAAEKYGLDTYSVQKAPVNYGSAMFLSSFQYSDSGQYLANLENNESSLKTLFAINEGELSDPISINSGILIAYCTEAEEAEELDTATLEMLYPYFTPQIIQSDYNQMVYSSEKFEDNFMRIFFDQILAIDS